jgi:hypothetical protein
VLARIEPLGFANVATIDEREPEAFPAPDWIVRGVPAPAGTPRSTVERVVAGVPVRDTTRLTVDSAAIAPDLTAIGDEVLTLRVLIDTTAPSRTPRSRAWRRSASIARAWSRSWRATAFTRPSRIAFPRRRG